MDGKKTLIVHGNGGYGNVIAEALGNYATEAVFTDDSIGTRPQPGQPNIIAIGDNSARSQMDNDDMRTVIHISATISPSAKIMPGCYIGAGAVVNANAVIHRGAIVNTGAIVEHDCEVGEFSHIAPGATLCGTVMVGNRCLIGANAVVRQNIFICDNVTVGCGAVVVKDITEPGVYVGNPCRPLEAVNG